MEAEGPPRRGRRRRNDTARKVAENLVPGSPREEPPVSAQAGSHCQQPAPLVRTSDQLSTQPLLWEAPLSHCPLGSFEDTPPQLLALMSLEGMEGRDRRRRTYRGATLRLLDKAKAAPGLENPGEASLARRETKVLFCFVF